MDLTIVSKRIPYTMLILITSNIMGQSSPPFSKNEFSHQKLYNSMNSPTHSLVSYFKFQDSVRVSPPPRDDAGGIGYGISYFIPLDKKKFNYYKSFVMHSADFYGTHGKNIAYFSFSYGKKEEPFIDIISRYEAEMKMHIVKFYHVGFDYMHRLKTGWLWPIIGYGLSFNIITEDGIYYNSNGGVAGDLIIGCMAKMSIINFQLLIKFVTPSLAWGTYEIIPYGGRESKISLYNNAGFMFNFGVNFRIRL